MEEETSKSYAMAWSDNQGHFSENLAKKIISFAKLKNINITSALDICCGSGNFLFELQKSAVKCTGTEFLDSYIAYNKKTFPNMTFVKTNSILDFDETKTYDLISCNHDVLNMLTSLDEWNIFFEKAYKHLNDGGILMFDFYSKKKLKDWNEVVFNESDKLDLIKEVKASTETNKTTITYNYYVNINFDDSIPSSNDKEHTFNDYNSKFKKSSNVDEEYYFETEEIFDLIKQNKYRYLIPTDNTLNPVATYNELNRIHVLAIKRET